MSKISGQAVWEKLCEEPELQNYTEAEREIMCPFVKATPTVLEGFLDKLVSLEVLMGAKLKFLRYCIDNDFANKMVDASRNPLSPRLINKIVGELITTMEDVANNVPAYLERMGVTEKQFMLSEDIGLSKEALSLYERGQLTIGKLLLIQPLVIVKNTWRGA